MTGSDAFMFIDLNLNLSIRLWHRYRILAFILHHNAFEHCLAANS